MNDHLKLAIWNANGLSHHRQEIQMFLKNQNIDIMLISETHFSDNSYIKIPEYIVYNTNHPDGTARGGTAIIIKKIIRHHEIPKFEQRHLQATSVVVEEWNGPITISAIYCPPRYIIKKEQFQQFFKTLGQRFIAGGDYNAKHQQWGSRLSTTKGRELLKAMQDNNLSHLSSGQPTYWPTDTSKVPDLIDFCVIKGISGNYLQAKSCLDLSSDHSPVLINVNSNVQRRQIPPTLCNKKTNWSTYRRILDAKIALNIPLKTSEDLENAVEHLCISIQEAAWAATPTSKTSEKNDYCPAFIKKKIAEKRKLRRQWQNTRTHIDKQNLNRSIKELKIALQEFKNKSIQDYLTNLSATDNTDYSLWKATKCIKQPQQHIPPIKDRTGNWARSDKEKGLAFAKHLESVFMPFSSTLPAEQEAEINEFLQAPFQMDLPVKKFKTSEVKSIIIDDLNPKKSPGYDLITGKVLKELSEKTIQLITFIYNTILRLEYFPAQWKVAQIILIPKPGKKLEDLQSYRPISLLPVISKIFEKLFVKRLKPILISKNLIPAHQFGFRQQHSTVEQVHRIVDKISKDLEAKRYCAAAFLDVSQAFDKVWHKGLLYKLKLNIPHHYYQILKSYLSNRYFQVKYNEELSTLFPIQSGVPQGSVLGPILYLLFTADLPTTSLTTTATFADDTAILASHSNPIIASRNLQNHINKTQVWLQKWRIKANETKSVQVTFTMKKESCPAVQLNGQTIPQAESAKYLGLHLDRRLTWQKHIFIKRKQLGLKLNKMYWLMGHRSQLSIYNKLSLYKSILKPIWTYGIQLWGTASNSNIEILQRFQSKVLRQITNAPWYVPNSIIQNDLEMISVKDEIKNYSVKYSEKLSVHPNQLAVDLLDTQSVVRRLKRFKPSDLPTRFD